MLTRQLAAVLLAAASLAAQAPTITQPTFHRTRTIWFVEGENPIGAEVGFAAEQIPWSKENEQSFTNAPTGARIGLGASMWAALETFTELKFGKVEVKAGNHYAVLEKTKDGWALGLLDPDAVRKAQEVPGIAKAQRLTASIPLHADTAAESPLGAEWKPGSESGTAELTIHLGPHLLRAEATVAGAKGAQPIALPDPRGASRAAFGKSAFAAVDHGVPKWNDELAGQAKDMPAGTRWRLGKDWATTLDTNCALLLGDKKLAAGSWHLTLGRTAKGWNLVVSSAAADHKGKIDGFGADYVSPVLEVPLTTAPAKEPASELKIEFMGEGESTVLAIGFGEERLSVPVAVTKG